ncbi:MAG: hypothetical protein LBE08_05230, partial [Bifidobacteriaceae bacterium]|nr:hypothetical protein [Bifidobacteriaceae bacterium]
CAVVGAVVRLVWLGGGGRGGAFGLWGGCAWSGCGNNTTRWLRNINRSVTVTAMAMAMTTFTDGGLKSYSTTL